MTHAAPPRHQMLHEREHDAVRYSIFTVQDHYPEHDRTVAEFYAESVQHCVLAETLGYDSYFVAEHHFAPYGTVPNPAVFLSHLAARTHSIRLGSAISVLSFHPAFEIAENYAMVDVLSGGRVTLGIGSGYLAHEMKGYGVDMAAKRERYDEAASILMQALSGQRFSHHGQHFHIDDMQVNVQALQQPGLPIYVAVSDANVAFFVARQGHNMMFVPYSRLEKIDDVGGVLETYRKGRREYIGEDAATSNGDVIVAFHAHVARNDEQALRQAEEPFALYLRTRQRAKHQAFTTISGPQGLSLIGSPDTVAAKVAALHALGVRHIMLIHNFGAMPADLASESIRLFAQEVRPRVNRLVAQSMATETA